MFVATQQREVTVGTESVVIRKLSARSLEKASEARAITQSAGLRMMGGEVVKALFRDKDTAAPVVGAPVVVDYVAATKARYEKYDRGTVLLAGIVRWSYGESVSADPLELVSDEDAQSIHEAILDYALPPLDPKEFEARQLKDSGRSINT